MHPPHLPVPPLPQGPLPAWPSNQGFLTPSWFPISVSQPPTPTTIFLWLTSTCLLTQSNPVSMKSDARFCLCAVISLFYIRRWFNRESLIPFQAVYYQWLCLTNTVSEFCSPLPVTVLHRGPMCWWWSSQCFPLLRLLSPTSAFRQPYRRCVILLDF